MILIFLNNGLTFLASIAFNGDIDKCMINMNLKFDILKIKIKLHLIIF